MIPTPTQLKNIVAEQLNVTSYDMNNPQNEKYMIVREIAAYLVNQFCHSAPVRNRSNAFNTTEGNYFWMVTNCKTRMKKDDGFAAKVSEIKKQIEREGYKAFDDLHKGSARIQWRPDRVANVERNRFGKGLYTSFN